VSVERFVTSDPAWNENTELEGLRGENARLKAALAEAERRNTLLRAELRHQVRNALAIVESVVRRTARTSDTLEYYTTHLEGRLAAIRRSQRMASLSAGEGGIGLEFLLAEELLVHGAHEGQQISLSGPAVQLRGEAAASLGLAFHELAVYSLTYGALSSPDGRIAITWGLEPGDSGREPAGGFLRLDWVETGGLAPADRPKREGFGTELIERMLAYQLGGEASLNFAPRGLHCTISLRLTEHLRVEPSP
jgi:two-component system, chemotaxis family, CheB/CheR fusion protein